jgi:hypothetical protein
MLARDARHDAVASANDDPSVVNGGFETGDASGWSINDSGNGSWFVYDTTVSPVSGQPVGAPPEGTFAVTTDQTGPGTHILAQDIVVPSLPNVTLSFLLYYENRADAFYSPETLSHDTEANQQYRVDVMTTTSPLDSVNGSDILMDLYRTQPGDPLSLAMTEVCADVSPLVGQTVRLRFAEVDDQYYFQASADLVQITSGCPTPPPPPPADADLVVTSIGLSPSEPAEGDGISFTATVTNVGNGTASSGWTFFQIDGPSGPSTYVDTPSLAPGASVNVTTSPAPPLAAGGHTIAVAADHFNDTLESDENNNVLSRDFVVIQRADLGVQVTSLRRVPLETELGELRHPLSRFEATVLLCEVTGVGPLRDVYVGYALHGTNRSEFVSGGYVDLGYDSIGDIAAGSCLARTVRFDAFGVVGDFVFTAHGNAGDRNSHNNDGSAMSYTIVRGEVGLVLAARRVS